MDFMKEIWDRSLPNFGYVIEADNGGVYVVVLGGQFIPKGEARRFRDVIIRRNEQMQRLYGKETLTVEDKKDLACLMHKMYAVCECREEGIHTREEQAAFIDKLSVDEKKQLAYQIQMLKDCRSYYRDYVHRG